MKTKFDLFLSVFIREIRGSIFFDPISKIYRL